MYSIRIHHYPLAVRLVTPLWTQSGTFGFTLTGPPAVYNILSSTNLADWTGVGILTNRLGAAVFTVPQAALSSQGFYDAITLIR